jgi:hypothetical protein
LFIVELMYYISIIIIVSVILKKGYGGKQIGIEKPIPIYMPPTGQSCCPKSKVIDINVIK